MKLFLRFYDYILAMCFLLFATGLFLAIGEIIKIIPLIDGHESISASFYELKGCKDNKCIGSYSYTVDDKQYFINVNDVQEIDHPESIKVIYDIENPKNNLKDGIINSISFCVFSLAISFLFFKATRSLLKNRKEVYVPAYSSDNNTMNNNNNVKLARAGIKIIRVIFYLIFYPFFIIGFIILIFIYVDYKFNSSEAKADFDKVLYCEIDNICNVQYKFNVNGKTYYIEEEFDKDKHSNTIDIEYYEKHPEFAMYYAGYDNVYDGFILFTLITVDLLFIVSFVSKFDKIKLLISIIKEKK